MQARYLRIVGLQLPSSTLALSELQVQAGGVRIAAAVTCIMAPSMGALAALDDGDLYTEARFDSAGAAMPGFALLLDCAIVQTVDAIAIGSGAARDWFPTEVSVEAMGSDGRWRPFAAPQSLPWPGANALAVISQTGDPSYASVWAALRFDGDLADAGPGGRAFAAVDSAAVTATAARFGGGGLSLPKEGSWVSSADTVALTSDFTIEFSLATLQQDERVIVDGYENRDWQVEIRNGRIWLFNLGEGIGNTIVADGVWHHVAVQRRAGRVEVWVDGRFDGAATVPTAFGATRIALGAQAFRRNASYDLVGRMDEFRLTLGVARYSVASPPHAQFATGLGVEPVQNVAARVQRASLNAKNFMFGGAGRIFGSTALKGAPDAPAKARVVLLRQRDHSMVAEVWSDAETGNFVFEGLDTAQQYITLAEGAAGNYRPVAANRLAPEVPQ